ncbi:MAG: RnfABCDGE type electron transport complex subunit G [Candidatus Latescibacterota bacterium]
MGNIVKLAVTLGLITVLAAGSLALVNQATRPKIEAYKAEQQIKARREVLPAAGEGVYVPSGEESDFPYYTGYAHSDTTEPVGRVFLASAKGYSSTLEMVVGVDLGGALTGLSIVSQQETPGLGAKITEIRYGESESWFQAQFTGKTRTQLLVDKDGGRIDSITGATISSRAVTDGIRKALEKLEAQTGAKETQGTQSSEEGETVRQ